MPSSSKRDNSYWSGRLRKDGHGDILDRYDAGEISMYRARQLAGYLPKRPPSPAAKLSHHWKRASHDERKRFVIAHVGEVNRVLREIAQDARERQAKKSSK